MTPDHACVWATSADVYSTANTLAGAILVPWVIAAACLFAWVGFRIWMDRP